MIIEVVSYSIINHRVVRNRKVMVIPMLKQFWAPLLALLGVCIGALLTGILSILNSYYQAVTIDEREKNKLILGKLEDLFDTIERVRGSYQNSLLTFHRYLIRTE